MSLKGREIENVLATNRAQSAQKRALPGDRQESGWTGSDDDRDSRVGGSHHIYGVPRRPPDREHGADHGRAVSVVGRLETAEVDIHQ